MITINNQPMTEQELKNNLKDRKWRLSNLYWIKDTWGNDVLFRPNFVQLYLLENLWYLNIILKARQLGITTFFCILYLDDCLFNGFDSGLIAHTRTDAEKIFDSKVKFAWDHLPEAIKAWYILDSDTARELKFINKVSKTESSIYVGTSLRSGTVQRLHISELGTIDQRYPAKAQEIRSGALNTVHKGSITTIESTAKGEVGIFADYCKDAMDIQKLGRRPNPMEWKFFFFPWMDNPEYYLNSDMSIPTEMNEYFSSIEAQTGRRITQGQRAWYYSKYKTQGDAMKSEFPSTPKEAFEASIDGAYYAKQMDRVMSEKRITSVPYIPTLPVDTWWDLGIATKKTDAMSIIFTQDLGLEIHVIDFYSNSGEGLEHYAKALNDKQYSYRSHNGPHDLQVKEIGTGKSRIEVARSLGLNFKVVPKLSVADGMEAVRMILSTCWFDEQRTDRLVNALKTYRKAWDEVNGRFKDSPINDWSCDPADAFRMMAVGHKDHRTLGMYDAEEEKLKRIQEYQRTGTVKRDVLNPFGNI